ncbi:hypothetical protein PR048_005298 [Dryococelus australis]|uniref:Uncharacterized protein n=1 Tax=Dryococelus australis TaxID=614101 RepID=A0ABQ9I8B0_9NEOP|nr:hypothetical protein PR048_005298 [Dryococelus australis]
MYIGHSWTVFSQSNFISENIMKRLQLEQSRVQVHIKGINNAFLSMHSPCKRTLTCLVLPQVTSQMPAEQIDTSKWQFPADVKLADEHFHSPCEIDLLIGAEPYFELLEI